MRRKYPGMQRDGGAIELDSTTLQVYINDSKVSYWIKHALPG